MVSNWMTKNLLCFLGFLGTGRVFEPKQIAYDLSRSLNRFSFVSALVNQIFALVPLRA